MWLDSAKCFLVAVVVRVGVCFRAFGFVGWGARRRCCGMVLLLRSVGLGGGGKGGGGLGCSVVEMVEAFSICYCSWVVRSTGLFDVGTERFMEVAWRGVK